MSRLGPTGLTQLLTDIKTWITTKLGNYVTTDTVQTVTGKKLFTASAIQLDNVTSMSGSTMFINTSASAPRGAFPENDCRVGRVYIGDGTSYNGAWFIVDPTITSTKAYYRMVTTNPDNTDSTRFSITWDSTKTGARCRKNVSMGDLLPAANNTYNLGADDLKWDIGYIHNLIGTNKENLTEDANSYYSTTSGSHMTFYTTSNGGTKLSNVPAAVNTHLESRTIRYLSSSDWIIEQICHNSFGLYYRKGTNGTWEDWKTFAFTNSNITGTASNVTGTVAIANGGTGATTRLNAVKALTNEAVSTPTYFLTITNGWAKAGYTTIAQAKTVLGITGDMGSHSDSEYVHKTGDESITGTKTFGNGTLIVDNGTGNNVHGEIKLNGTRPVYINADNSEDGLFANTSCGMSILLNDSSKSIHIGGITTGNNGRKLIKTTEKAPYLTLGTQEVGTQILVPENDTADSTFSITSTLKYASGASAKSFTVKFKQGDDGSSGVFPVANNKTDLGLSGNRWKNVYATNYYYGAGAVEFSTKFVTTDTAQTITGVKTFASSPVIYNSDTTGSVPQLTFKNSKTAKGSTTETGAQLIYFADKNNAPLSMIESRVVSNGCTTLSTVAYNFNDSQNVSSSVQLIKNPTTAYYAPGEDNDISLGRASARWLGVYATNYYYGSDNVEFSTKFVTTDTAQTITGVKTFNSDTLVANQGNAYRIANSAGTGYGVLQRMDGTYWYMLVTANNDPLGTWTSARPIVIRLSDGYCTINGKANEANKVQATIAAGTTAALVQASVASNDVFRIAAGGAANAGWAEIATGDDASEPIYVRQYKGAFTTLQRTATLLDGSGNTSFPGTVTATGFSGPLTGDVTGTATKATSDANGREIATGYMWRGSYERIVGTSEEHKDLNTYQDAGFYNVKTALVDNCPSGIGVDAVLLVYPWDHGNYPTQEITEAAASSNARRWVRKCNNGTWSDWKRIAFTTDDISGTAAKATGNANGNEITDTVIKGLSISGKTITYTKIDGNTGTLTTQDTVYTHPTTSGNKHIPSGGSSGQFLGWDSDGTAKWVNNPNTNTDTLMTQNVSTTDSTYPILLCATANATSNQGAKTGIFGSGVKVNPKTSVVSAKGFSGVPTGNTYVTAVKDGGALVNSQATSWGAIWRAPTKDYQVAGATWSNNNNNVYICYSVTNANAEAGTNTMAKSLIWAADTGTLTTTTFSGALSGNASTATEFSANKDVTLTGDVTGTASSKAGWSVATTLANSGVTAGTYGPSADVTGSNNATILVPEITVDAKGRVTAVNNRTYTSVNTDNDKKVYQYYKSDNDVYRLLFSNNAGNTATSNVGAAYSGLNNSFYVNPSTGALYATKLYSNGVEVLTSHQSLSNYVTLNTAQEITNTKTFKDATTVRKLTSVEAGNVIPSSDKLISDIWQDKNGKELGRIYYAKTSGGNTALIMRAGDWFSESEGVYSLNASGTNRRAELHLYSDANGNCCIKPVGYFSATLKALSTSVWLGESTKPFGRVYANAFEFCNAGLLPDTDVQTTEEHSIGFFGQNNTPLSYITFQKRPNLKDRIAVRIQTATSAYKSYCFDATCFYPESSNNLDIGSTTNIFKNIYCNNYYKGTTAFGDIVTHNASEFLTQHPSITLSTNTTSTESPSHGGTFTCIDSVTQDANGHITKVNTKTVTLPADSNTDTKVTQTVTNGNAYYPLLIANTASASHTGAEPTTETDEVRKAYNINVQARYGFIYARNSYSSDNLKGSVAGGNRTSAGFYGSTYDGATVGGVELGRVDKYGNRYSRLYATNYITDGALAPDGTAVAATFDVGVLADGTKYLNTSAGWYCNVYPTVDNTRTLGTSSLRWKECYSNAYYLGTTAFGDIVTHNASEFLTSHQSLSSCVKNSVTNSQTIKSTAITRGTAPSSAQAFGIGFSDNNDKYIGNVYGQYATDKSTYVGLYAYKGTTTSNGDNVSVRVGYDASGNAYTYAPTPATADNSTQIATTAFVKAQGYLTSHQSLDNYVTLNSNQTITAIKTITGGNQGKMIFKNPNYTKGDALESSVTISRLYFGNNASYDSSNAVLTTDVTATGISTVELCAINNTASNSNRASLILSYDKSATRPRLVKSWGDFAPYQDNTYTLGSSSLKWKNVYAVNFYENGTALSSKYAINENFGKGTTTYLYIKATDFPTGSGSTASIRYNDAVDGTKLYIWYSVCNSSSVIATHPTETQVTTATGQVWRYLGLTVYAAGLGHDSASPTGILGLFRRES